MIAFVLGLVAGLSTADAGPAELQTTDGGILQIAILDSMDYVGYNVPAGTIVDGIGVIPVEDQLRVTIDALPVTTADGAETTIEAAFVITQESLDDIGVSTAEDLIALAGSAAVVVVLSDF